MMTSWMSLQLIFFSKKPEEMTEENLSEPEEMTVDDSNFDSDSSP